MLPKFQPLFPDSRILAGKNTRMQGYGQAKSISGVTVQGSGSILAQRTQKSSGIPVLTDQDVLRAGSNVRIHGRDRILVIERIPEPVEQEEMTPIASLKVEYEILISTVYPCAASLGDSNNDPDGVWVISVSNYGVTTTYAGTFYFYGPGDPPPVECEEPSYSGEYDSEAPAGEIKTTVSWASQTNSFLEALEIDPINSGDYVIDFPFKDWELISKEPFGEYGSYNPFIGSSIFRTGFDMSTTRVRLTNVGNTSLRIICGFYGLEVDGGASDIETTLNLKPKQASNWFNAPTPEFYPLHRYFMISRVKIGKWQSVS